jgi:hypothetical protein
MDRYTGGMVLICVCKFASVPPDVKALIIDSSTRLFVCSAGRPQLRRCYHTVPWMVMVSNALLNADKVAWVRSPTAHNIQLNEGGRWQLFTSSFAHAGGSIRSKRAAKPRGTSMAMELRSADPRPVQEGSRGQEGLNKPLPHPPLSACTEFYYFPP